MVQPETGGFFYVVLPVDEAMRQVYFPCPATELNDLGFMRALRAELGKEAVVMEGLREKLLEELVDSSRAGRDNSAVESSVRQEEDKVRDALQKVDNDQLEMLAAMRNFKVILLRDPSENAAKKGVFLYHEDTAEGPVNKRAMNLCVAAGFPPQDIRGTCFLSQTEEFYERDCSTPIWRRCDFTLRDCRDDAQWFKDARRLRNESGLKQKEDAEWFSGLEDGGAPMAEGDSELYAWKQTSDEIEVVFHSGPFAGIRATKKDITVKFSRRSLYVRLRGRILCKDETLAGEVDPENSCWTFDKENMELQVTLSKAEAGEWKTLMAKAHRIREAPKAKPAQKGKERRDHVTSTVAEDIEAGVAAGTARGLQATPRRRPRWRILGVLLLLYVLLWLAWHFASARRVRSDLD